MTYDFSLNFFSAFLVGGTSSAIATTIVAPLETIKLILQTQKAASNISTEQEYKGLMDCLIRIPKEQGVFSFWRGNLASVIRGFPYKALNFSLKDLFRSKMHTDSDALMTRFMNNLLAGGLAGVCALSVIYPLDYARTRLAVDIGKGDKRLFQNVRDCLKQTFKAHGIRAMYRGYTFSVFGVFIYRALFFGMYDTIMECVSPEYQHSLWVEFPAAEFSATLAGFVSYPIDTVRRQMMLQNFGPYDMGGPAAVKNVKYRNTWDCWQKIYRAEGFKGFFHGGLTNVYRGAGGALTLVLYDNIQSWLLEDHPILARYIPIRHNKSVQNETPQETPCFYKTLHSDKKPPCKIFKDRSIFCNF